VFELIATSQSGQSPTCGLIERQKAIDTYEEAKPSHYSNSIQNLQACLTISLNMPIVSISGCHREITESTHRCNRLCTKTKEKAQLFNCSYRNNSSNVIIYKLLF